MSATKVERRPRRCTAAEWFAEGERLYGPDRMKWKFVCPVCGHVATGEEWLKAGANKSNIGFSCIGRWLPGTRSAFEERGVGPCNYAGGGLFQLNPVTITHEGEEDRYFEFADHVESLSDGSVP